LPKSEFLKTYRKGKVSSVKLKKLGNAELFQVWEDEKMLGWLWAPKSRKMIQVFEISTPDNCSQSRLRRLMKLMGQNATTPLIPVDADTGKAYFELK